MQTTQSLGEKLIVVLEGFSLTEIRELAAHDGGKWRDKLIELADFMVGGRLGEALDEAVMIVPPVHPDPFGNPVW